jgi:outer membrane murein-binding lipoprotein Lpp
MKKYLRVIVVVFAVLFAGTLVQGCAAGKKSKYSCPNRI